MADPQYTDAQLSDGRTLRFMGQLGPDEVRQKVHAFRTNEGAQQIQANPPSVPRPQPDMQSSFAGTLEGGPTDVPGSPQKVPRSIQNAPDSLGDSIAGLTAVGAVAPVVGAAVPPAARFAARHPLMTMAGIEAAKRLPGAAGQVAGKIPSWLPLLAGNPEAAGDAEETGMEVSQPRLIQKVTQAPTGKPSGRLILSEAEAQAEAKQMSLAKKMASQRGMQYAAGMRPEDPQ